LICVISGRKNSGPQMAQIFADKGGAFSFSVDLRDQREKKFRPADGADFRG
jgi:hypothetical protein